MFLCSFCITGIDDGLRTHRGKVGWMWCAVVLQAGNGKKSYRCFVADPVSPPGDAPQAELSARLAALMQANGQAVCGTVIAHGQGENCSVRSPKLREIQAVASLPDHTTLTEKCTALLIL